MGESLRGNVCSICENNDSWSSPPPGLNNLESFCNAVLLRWGAPAMRCSYDEKQCVLLLDAPAWDAPARDAPVGLLLFGMLLFGLLLFERLCMGVIGKRRSCSIWKNDDSWTSPPRLNNLESCCDGVLLQCEIMLSWLGGCVLFMMDGDNWTSSSELNNLESHYLLN